MTTKKTAAKDAAPKPIKTNIHSIFATNESKEEGGAWVDVNALWGLKIKVRRLRSDASVKAYEEIVTEQLGDGVLRKLTDVSADQSMAILKEQLARAVLVDWKNLRDVDSGEEIPYDIETARALMDVKDFREFVWQAANERDTFKGEADEAAEGN
jgi:hypothetical protein